MTILVSVVECLTRDQGAALIYIKTAFLVGELSGSVVECLTQDRMAAGSRLTGVTALSP